MSDVQPDLTEFYRYSQPAKPPCKLGIMLSTGSPLKVAEREQLSAALDQPSNVITGAAIVKWLDARKVTIPVNSQNIQYHRKGSCTCVQSAA